MSERALRAYALSSVSVMTSRLFLSVALLSSYACEPQRSAPPPPDGPHLVVLASSGDARRPLGWLQVTAGEGEPLMRRVLQLSADRPVAVSARHLRKVSPSQARLTWRFEVGDQEAEGRVELDCDQPIYAQRGAEASCEVSFMGEGAPRVLKVSGPPPLVSELWPWQLSAHGCPVDGRTISRSLIRPLSAELSVDGLRLSCLPLSEAPAGMPVTWGARYKDGEERGLIWWTTEGLGMWEAQTGALTWSILPSTSELARVQAVGELSIERLALAPITTSKGRAPLSRSAWRALTWARVRLRRHDGRPVRLLEGARVQHDPHPSAWTLSKRGPSLEHALEEAQAGPPPLSALKGTPHYTTQALEVRRLVEELAPQSSAPIERARALWIWVRTEIQEEPRAGLPRVLETLSTRAGDCNEQSALLTTLLRAADVPAEQVFGLVALGADAGYHAWVRVWLSGVWVEVDPTRGLPFVTAGHWPIAAGDERAQEALRSLLMSVDVELSAWSSAR